MYIYLSDRKRRMYLSYALPQNLYPKKPLSVKDIRFLQKAIRNIKENLSFRLIKQQKILYEKHISMPLKYKTSLVNFSFKGKKLQLSEGATNTRFSLYKTPVYLSVWQQFENYQTFVLGESIPSLLSNQRYAFSNNVGYKENTYLNQCKRKRDKFMSASDTKFAVHGPKDCAQQMLSKKHINFEFSDKSFSRFDNSISNISHTSALYIHVQTIKTRYKNPQKHKYGFENPEIIKNCFLNPTSCFDICKRFANAPLFVNGTSKYMFCRFLYTREHIKTSLNPQILQNQNSKNLSSILNERKKVALFYGQIAKKDLQILSRNAKTLPGLFEDNMYALLESRVDVCVHRAGFSDTIAMARQLIRNGSVYLNGKPCISTKTLAQPGDIFTVKSRKNTEIFENCYRHLTKVIYQSFFCSILKKQNLSKNFIFRATRYKHKSLCFTGILYPGFLLHGSSCKPFLQKPVLENAYFSNLYKPLTPFSPSFVKNKLPTQNQNGNFFYNLGLNVYIGSLLKKLSKKRKHVVLTLKQKYSKQKRGFLDKNTQNACCVPNWGYKPLHLEISQKTNTFIYLYRPQKIISPICMDFYALKV